jgi:Flp pilus assembly secretin CpaC
MRCVAVGSLLLSLGLARAGRGQETLVPAPPAPQAEAEEDGAAAKKERQIQLKVIIAEYSRTKLRQVGIDFTESFGKQVASDGLAAFLVYMRRNNFAVTSAEPTLITTEGRPVHFDGPDRFGRKLGTELTFTPTLLGEGRVRLNLHTVTTEIDRQASAANGRWAPRFKTSQTDHDFELDLGGTIICPGRTATAMQQVRQGWRTMSSPVETQMLYIVTPELVAAEERRAPPPSPPIPQDETP